MENGKEGCPRCQPQEWLVKKDGPRKTYKIRIPGRKELLEVCERCDPIRILDRNRSTQYWEDPCFQGAI